MCIYTYVSLRAILRSRVPWKRGINGGKKRGKEKKVKVPIGTCEFRARVITGNRGCQWVNLHFDPITIHRRNRVFVDIMALVKLVGLLLL